KRGAGDAVQGRGELRRAAGGPPRRQRQRQQDEAGQAPRGVRGGHERDGTDDPIRELRFDDFRAEILRREKMRDANAIIPIAAQRPPDAYNSGNLKTGRAHKARSIYPSSQGRSFQRSDKAGRLSGPRATRTFLAFCAYPAPDLSLRIFRDARSATR